MPAPEMMTQTQGVLVGVGGAIAAAAATTVHLALRYFQKPKPLLPAVPIVPAQPIAQPTIPKPELIIPPAPSLAPAVISNEAQGISIMSDVSVTVHNTAALLEGKINFAQWEAGEAAMLQKNIASAPAAIQGALSVSLDSLKAGVSSLVGIGLTAAGPVLSASTADQTTMVMNLLSALGVKTVGPLSLAEQAVVSQLITGLKAGLDKIGIQVATQGTSPAVAVEPQPQPAHEAQPEGQPA